MTWNQLLQRNWVQRHSTNQQEIDNLRQIVSRGLADASVTAISSDLRFQAAYNAVLQLATIAIHCAGYRVRGREHHKRTFQALPLVMGDAVAKQAAYFDMCRQKRNATTYDQTGMVSETEVEELLREANSFQRDLEDWIKKIHPNRASS